MSLKLGIYKCEVCGNIVQVFIEGEGELVCCGQEMKLMEKQYEQNELGEKHVPAFEMVHEGCESGVCTDAKYVRVNKHPMTEEHYIQFIEVLNSDKTELRIKFLKPNDAAKFNVTNFGDNLTALEFCNIHGLWIGNENKQM